MKIFDMHVFIGKSLFQKDFFYDDLQNLKTKYNLTQAALIATKPYEYNYITPNQSIAKICTENDDLHILRLDPWHLEESIKMIHQYKSKAIFLHFFEEQIYPSHQNVFSIVEEASKENMTVIMACGYLPFSHSAQIVPLIKAFPKTKFVLTHGAQINISGMHMAEAFEIFTANPHTFFETSGIYREDYIEEAITKLGVERVLFGSGTPYYHFPYEVKRIEYLNVKDDIKEKILWHNAQTLFAQHLK